MSDKKNIDRLFQEAFKDFEATPSNAVWNKIEARLNQKKKKRRVIPIWWRYAGVAALLLLLLTIGNSFFNAPSDDITPSNQVVETEGTRSNNSPEKGTTNNQSTHTIIASDNSDNHIESENESDKILNIKNASEAITPSNESTIAETNSDKYKTKGVSNTSYEKKANPMLESEKHDAIANNSDQKNRNTIQDEVTKTPNIKSKEVLDKQVNNNLAIAEKENTSLDTAKTNDVINSVKKNNATTTIADEADAVENDVIAENKEEEKTPTIEAVLEESKDIIEKEERFNRWSITPNAAPVYFNTLAEGSSIDGQFNSNQKTAEANMSYGISASYAVNKKLRIRSGINKVNLGYNTNNVVVFETLAKSSTSSLLSASSPVETTSRNTNIAENVSLVSAESIESNDSESLVLNSNTSLNQSFGYIEVPLEIQYMLSDKKLGINVIGGFSSFFLSDNELFSEIEGSRTSIGEATNINNVSYSANLGLGFQYKFTEKLHLNLEPMFKYQMNTFNNTSGNFTPYFIGVYTGIGFKF